MDSWEIGQKHLVAAAAAWALLTAGSLAVVIRVVLGLPEDYFETEPAARPAWTVGRLARNLAGIALVVIGALLSLPGVPGQGLLTVLVGLFLVDFPRRGQLERAVASRPGVLAALNRLRVRYGRRPLRPPRL
jgi:hypothetical protein